MLEAAWGISGSSVAHRPFDELVRRRAGEVVVDEAVVFMFRVFNGF
jgi:hypothetical protein